MNIVKMYELFAQVALNWNSLGRQMSDDLLRRVRQTYETAMLRVDSTRTFHAF